jgi:hypothetical protein
MFELSFDINDCKKSLADIANDNIEQIYASDLKILIDRLQAAEAKIQLQEQEICELQSMLDELDKQKPIYQWKNPETGFWIDCSEWFYGREDNFKTRIVYAKQILTKEPIEWQYQRVDGSWKSFENEKHKNDTINCGLYNIRPLYLKLTNEDK